MEYKILKKTIDDASKELRDVRFSDKDFKVAIVNMLQ